MANQCSECVYCHRDRDRLFREYYCTYYLNNQGKYRSVSPTGCCNSFRKRATFEDSGYKNGNSGCFLTSACVDYFGKPDDCEELQASRSFRDNKLKNREDGEALIQEYYQIAPAIVQEIEASDKQEEHYRYIYACIQNCLSCIEQGDDEKTLTIYKDMVLTLKEKFNL